MYNIYFDTETSGLKPGQIGQLAAIIESENGVIGKNYYFKIKSIDSGAEKVTGRNKEWYAKASGGIVFADKVDEIANIFNYNRLIAHNIQFDEAFMSMEFFRCNYNLIVADRFDTMQFFKPIMQLPGRNGMQYKNPKLCELMDYLHIDNNKVAEYASEIFGIKSTDFHDAIFDTTSVFVACKVYNDSVNSTSYFMDRFSL